MYFLISGNDIYQLDLTSQQIDISTIANVTKIQMRCQKNIKSIPKQLYSPPSITRHSDGTETATPTIENICTLAVI